MDSLRKWFTFSRGERVALVTLLLCLAFLLVAVLLRKPRASLDEASLHNLDSLLALRQAAMEESRNKTEPDVEGFDLQPFPFNPNTMTEEEGLRMGLTDRQVRNIINYREKGGKFYSKHDLAKLYTIGEETFAQLEPYIVLPEMERRAQPKKTTQKQDKQDVATEKKEPKAIPVVDLNTADSALLVELPQLGPYTVARIIVFREKLGGFINKEQLRDVKGMDAARFETIAPYVRIEEGEVRKIDVNRADFKTLVNHPYLNYNQVKRIFDQREKRGMIKDWEQLERLLGEDEPLNPMLQRYVKF